MAIWLRRRQAAAPGAAGRAPGARPPPAATPPPRAEAPEHALRARRPARADRHRHGRRRPARRGPLAVAVPRTGASSGRFGFRSAWITPSSRELAEFLPCRRRGTGDPLAAASRGSRGESQQASRVAPLSGASPSAHLVGIGKGIETLSAIVVLCARWWRSSSVALAFAGLAGTASADRVAGAAAASEEMVSEGRPRKRGQEDPGRPRDHGRRRLRASDPAGRQALPAPQGARGRRRGGSADPRRARARAVQPQLGAPAALEQRRASRASCA